MFLLLLVYFVQFSVSTISRFPIVCRLLAPSIARFRFLFYFLLYVTFFPACTVTNKEKNTITIVYTSRRKVMYYFVLFIKNIIYIYFVLLPPHREAERCWFVYFFFLFFSFFFLLYSGRRRKLYAICKIEVMRWEMIEWERDIEI